MSNTTNHLSGHAHLISEWHHEKNAELLRASGTIGLHRKVWWRCSKNHRHEWQTTIFERRERHSGCPYCAGKKVLPEDSFAALYPELLIEWDEELNGLIRPDLLLPGSNKKVYWRCAVDTRHSWAAAVVQRTKRNAGCPYCSGRMFLREDSFGAKFPDLAKHLDPHYQLDVFAISPYSKKTVDWICPNDPTHKWRTSIGQRTRGNTGCPFCAGQRIPRASNIQDAHPKSLAKQNPALIAEWDSARNSPLTPFDVMAGSGKKAWWICSRFPEHRWSASIANRNNGTGCPECTNQTSRPELRVYSELKFLFPDTVLRRKIDGIELDVFIPKLKVAIEYDGYYYHREKHDKDLEKNRLIGLHEIVLIRVREKGLKPVSENDIFVERSTQLQKEAVNELIRLIIHVKSEANTQEVKDYLRESQFRNDELYNTYISYFPNPFPELSLANNNSEAKSYWDYEKNQPLAPENFTVFSTKTVWWKCDKDHAWQAKIADFSTGSRCPYCASHLLSKEKTFAHLHPDLASLWHFEKNYPATPDEVFARSGKKVWWKCPNFDDHEWEAPPRNLSVGKGCPFCAGRKVSRSMSLGNTNLSLSSEWDFKKNDPLTPFDVLPGSGKKVWWKCKKGHSWQAAPLTRKKNGCAQCRMLKTRSS